MWLQENWQWALPVGVFSALVLFLWRRSVVRAREVAWVRALWAQLPAARQAEILHARERIYRCGDVGPIHVAESEERNRSFESYLRNALEGERWAFDLLLYQLTEHAAAAGLYGPGSRALYQMP